MAPLSIGNGSNQTELVDLVYREFVGLTLPKSRLEIQMLDRLLQADLAQAIVWRDWDDTNLHFGEAAIGVLVDSAGAAAGLVYSRSECFADLLSGRRQEGRSGSGASLEGRILRGTNQAASCERVAFMGYQWQAIFPLPSLAIGSAQP